MPKSKKTVGFLEFFTLTARLAFTKLKQAFVKILIFHHFDLKYHIWIKINILGYAIGEVLSELVLNDLGQWHPIAFFSQKMILTKTSYETHNG